MSSQEENKQLDRNQQQQAAQDNAGDQPQKGKKAQKSEDGKKDWHSQANTVSRSQVDVITHRMATAFNVDNQTDAFTVEMLHEVPCSIPTDELVTTGSTNVFEISQQVNAFFEPFSFVQNGTSYFGLYVDEQMGTSCQFAVHAYRDVHSEIVFALDRVQGCGIAFARVFAQFNASISNNKTRQIWTFEAPALSPQPLLQHSSMNDTCPFDHASHPGATPIEWSTTTIADLISSQLQHQSGAQLMDLDLQSLPLSATAQAQMFNQCFDTLIAALGKTPVLKDLRHTEFDALTTFLTALLSNEAQSAEFQLAYPMLNFLLSHPILTVRIAILSLLDMIAHAFPQYVFSVVTNEMLDSFGQANALQLNDENCSPFDFLHHQTIQQYVDSLSAQCRAQ